MKTNHIPVGGFSKVKKPRKKPSHLEDDLQIAVMNYIRLQYPNALAIHVPNGGKRGSVKVNKYGQKYNPEAIRFKKMGVVSGVPDIIIFDQNYFKSGLAIELKVGYNSVSEKQKEFHEKLFSKNWDVQVCYDFDSAKKIIDSYLTK